MTFRFAVWFARLMGPIVLLAIGCGRASPVTFRFEAPPNAQVANPFARELWAQVVVPSGRSVVLPAFYDGNGVFAVHARPDELGEYRLTTISEGPVAGSTTLAARLVSPATVTVNEKQTLLAVTRDARDATRFVRSDGSPLIPVGANVAWADEGREPVAFYRDAFARFGHERLNWMRIWMAHWGRLNLDWKVAVAGRSPAPGTLAPDVVAAWDELLAAAESNRVYVQLVLQHHGQYSSRTNPNWNENPWNAAHPGGFLKTPEDFFVSPEARRLTKSKYRYIVARWSWSPAIFAWELFNEVHWVDAMATAEGRAHVAAWHAEMADWLRAIDPYHHLVTTSTEELASPIYAKMDYFQPHLYPADLIIGAQHVGLPQRPADRPVFYGEQGDDHVTVSEAVKRSGSMLVPAAWAGLLSEAGIPAQPWLGADILRLKRIAELGAVAKFAAGSGIETQRDLRTFTATTESDAHVPLELIGCAFWQRWPAPDLTIALDGTVTPELATVPRFYVARGEPDGFATHGAFHFDFPRATALHVKVASSGTSCVLRVLVDQAPTAVVDFSREATKPSPGHPRIVEVPVSAGRHTLVLQNDGAKGAIEVSAIDLGTPVSALAALGRRNASYIAAWLWNRSGVYADAPPAVKGTLLLPNVAPGQWRVTWWNTLSGRPGEPTTITHPGGTLRLPTPPISRHAAVVVEKE